jgi:nucleotide-binding universal stress UspA family protein
MNVASEVLHQNQRGEAVMSSTILLAVALHNWKRNSDHALAVREVGAALAHGASKGLHVLSVYDYEPINTNGLPCELAARYREERMQHTDTMVKRRLDTFIAPLSSAGIRVSKILRIGNPRNVVVQVAAEINADLLIIGSHSRRRLLDISLGGAVQQISRRAPCTVLLVSPGHGVSSVTKEQEGRTEHGMWHDLYASARGVRTPRTSVLSGFHETP